MPASRIGTYLRCPLRYYFEERRPWERISGAILLGAAVDRAAKEAVLLLKQGVEGLEEELDEIFDRLFRVEVGSAKAPIACGSRFDEESAKVMGRALLKQIAHVLLSKERLDRITGIDIPFTIPLVDEKGEPLMDTPLVGVLDFVEDTAEGPVPQNGLEQDAVPARQPLARRAGAHLRAGGEDAPRGVSGHRPLPLRGEAQDSRGDRVREPRDRGAAPLGPWRGHQREARDRRRMLRRDAGDHRVQLLSLPRGLREVERDGARRTEEPVHRERVAPRRERAQEAAGDPIPA